MFITEYDLKVDFAGVSLDTRKELLDMVLSCVGIQQEHCWEWLGIINKLGHGRIKVPISVRHKDDLPGTYSIEERWIPVHRLMYLMCFDRINWGEHKYQVHHACENASCVNPLHLIAKKSGFTLWYGTTDVSRVYIRAVSELLTDYKAEIDSIMANPNSIIVNQATADSTNENPALERLQTLRTRVRLLEPHLLHCIEYDATKLSIRENLASIAKL